MKKQATIVSELHDSRLGCDKLYLLNDGSYRMVFRPDSGFPMKEISENELAQSKADKTYIGLVLNFAYFAEYGVLTKASLRTNLTVDAEVEVYEYDYDKHEFGQFIGLLNCEKGIIDLTRFIKEAQRDAYFLAIENINSKIEMQNSYLEVDIIESNELMNNQKFITINADELSQVNVNILSGKVFESLSLLDLGGEGLPISLNIFYNSTDEGNHGLDTGLSPNFYTNYHQICYREETDTEVIYNYFDAQRVKHVFRPVIGNDSLWVDTQGTGLLLEDWGSGIRIFDHLNNNYNFDDLGRLSSIDWAFTGRVTLIEVINYDGDTGKITQVLSNGRKVRFEYGSSVKIYLGEDGKNEVEKARIDFSGQNLQVTMLGLKGKDSVYTLFGTPEDTSESSELSAPNGVKVNVEYALNTRVKSISRESVVNYFDYDYLSSMVRNEKGVNWVYEFSERGDFLSSFEKKDENTYSVAFRSDDPCIDYEGMLSEEKVLQWEDYSMTGPGKREFTGILIPGSLINRFAIFSAAIRIEEFTTQKPIKISLSSLSNTIFETEFIPETTGIKFIAIPFRYNGSLFDNFKLQYETESEGKFTFLNVCVTLPTNTVNALATTNSSFDSSGYEYQGKILSYFTKDIGIKVLLTNGQELSLDQNLFINDYLANDREYTTRTENLWNMWVDNKRMMIAGVVGYFWYYERWSIAFNGSEDMDFYLLSLNAEIMSAARISYLKNEQKEFERFGWTVTSFLHQTNLSYVNSSPATPNYTEELYYDEYNNLLYSNNIKHEVDYDYDFAGSLTYQKIQTLAKTNENIIRKWGYTDTYLTSTHSYYLKEELTTRMEYNIMGNVTKQTDPNGFETTLKYYPYGTNLESTSAMVNDFETSNQINYVDDKISSLGNNNHLIYSFTYNKTYPSMVESVSVGDQLYASLSFEPNAENSYSKYTTSYSNDQSIERYYDEYNHLVKMEVKEIVNGEKIITNCEISYSNGNTQSKAAGENVNSQSKISEINDHFVDVVATISYNSYGNVSKIDKKFSDYTKCNFEYQYDNRHRLSSKKSQFTFSEPPYTPEDRAKASEKTFEYQAYYTYEAGNNANQYNIKKTEVEISGQTLSFETSKDNLDRLAQEDIKLGEMGLTKRISYAERTNANGDDEGTTEFVAREAFYFNGGLFPLQAIDYTYDKNGNITSITRNGKTIKYIYDDANQLVGEENPILGYNYRYYYNSWGNLRVKGTYPFDSSRSDTRETRYEYENPENPDQLTLWGDDKFKYDSCGNPTVYKNKELTWTRGRLLKRYGDINFDYDYNGIRTKKKVNGKEHLYFMENGNLKSEEIGSGSSEVNLYFYNQNGIFGAQINGTVYYYVKNMLGDILEIRRAFNNSLAASYEYDAWGNHIVYDADGNENNDPTFIGNLNPFRYRGYYYDTDVKLYYLQTRWYDPEIGRFINLDQISYLDPETANGLNLYAYCGNNPVMGYDPTGTWILAFLLKKVIDLIVENVKKAEKGNEVEEPENLRETNQNDVERRDSLVAEPMLSNQSGPYIDPNPLKFGENGTFSDWQRAMAITVGFGFGVGMVGAILSLFPPLHIIGVRVSTIGFAVGIIALILGGLGGAT